MSRLATIVLGLLVAISAISFAHAQDDKNRVVLLLVAVPDQNARNDVNTWILLFKNNIRFLLTSSSSVGSSASRVINVIVRSENVDDIDADLLEASYGKQPSLQVLSTVGTHVNQATSVDTQIYLGDLKGSLADPYLKFSQKILREDYKITREALAAVTLYAYAMAVAKMLPPETSRFSVCQILDRANMYKGSVLDSTRSDLDSLFRAISAELEARACGGRR